jgi:signal transduction histidine kinase
MTFRNKILLSIWAVVLSLLIITFFILNYWMRSRIRETFTGELQTGLSTVAVHEKLQSAQLIRASRVIAESPRLRAVVELGDDRTAYQLLQELNKTTLSQLIVLTDREGRPLVQFRHGSKDHWDIAYSQTIQSALHDVASTEVASIRDGIYRVVSVPMVVETELVGTLTIGFEITGNDLATLKRATNCDILLVSEQKTFLSTLDSAEARSLVSVIGLPRSNQFTSGEESTGAAISFRTDGGEYLGSAYRLSQQDGRDSSEVFYLMLKPLGREVRQAMTSVLGTFGVVSLIFLVLTTIIGLFISRGITRPISELVRGTTEISQGNYDYSIRVRGRDELSILAQRFMAMSSSLKEKISELAKLNQDLLERNRDLDETLRKLQSAQEEIVRSERLAATGKMTAQLAHEINNPIHNIQSCLNTALKRLPQETRGRDLIEVAYDEAGRLSRLTGQMLNFYRGSLVEEELKPTNLNDMLDEIVLLMQDELSASKITLRREIKKELPVVRGSRDKLKQVILNLISNARDAMPQGGHMDIVASAENGTVRLAVKDDGVGIAKENLNRIFDAFFTTKKEVSGVGLGLSVCYSIVHQHGGTISVASSVGRGTTFTILLPVPPAETSQESQHAIEGKP